MYSNRPRPPTMTLSCYRHKPPQAIGPKSTFLCCNWLARSIQSGIASIDRDTARAESGSTEAERRMEDDRLDFEYEEAPIDAPPARRGNYNSSERADFQEEQDTREPAPYSRRPPPYGGIRDGRPRMHQYQPRPRGGFHAGSSGRVDDRRTGSFVPRSTRPGEYRPRPFSNNTSWQPRSEDHFDDNRPIRYQYVDDLRSDRHSSSNLSQEPAERRPAQRDSRSRSPPRPIRSPVREYSPEPESCPLEPPGFSEVSVARVPQGQYATQVESHFVESAPSKDSPSSNRRFIVLKCLYYDIIAKAKYDCSWPTRRSTAERIADLQDAGHPIYLFFSLDNSQHFQGTLAVSLFQESGHWHQTSAWNLGQIHATVCFKSNGSALPIYHTT